jgi:vacuolar-type H+-ATPase subunit I/STV1
MSTTIEAILVAALVFGIVAVLFGLIFVWDRWIAGSRLEQRIDRFFERLSDRCDR